MGYGEAPWEFRGRALYQLSLVRVEEARKYVPAELPLVSCLGWTLGGFYLARYSDSPVGAFDECVALAGLAWNFPASAAWAARVYVNDKVARDHGISSVGLPSRLASFKALPLPALAGSQQKQQGQQQQQQQQKRSSKHSSWWDLPHRRSSRGGGGGGGGDAAAAGSGTPTASLELSNSESSRRRRGLGSAVCCIEMPQLAPAWAPKIQMFLPSFSGATPDFPGLLKYSLKLTANIRPLSPTRVTFPEQRAKGDQGSPEVLDAVLGGRPLVCLAFDNMHMEVQPPEVWHPKASKAVAA